MEIENTENNSEKAIGASNDSDLIQVRAIISCQNCDYQKKFRNQFPRKDLELLTVAVKVFEFITCNTCGDLIKLDLEFNI